MPVPGSGRLLFFEICHLHGCPLSSRYEKHRFFPDLQCRPVRRFQRDMDAVGPLRALPAVDLHPDRDRAGLGALQRHFIGAGQPDGRNAVDQDAVALRLLGRVHDLQPVDVLDLAAVDHARQRAAVAHHVDLERRAHARLASSADAQRQQHGAVDQHARPQHAAHTSGAASSRCASAFCGGVADQAARIAHLVHHAVAGVDAGGAADALVLQALADVDAGRADLHAQRAVDAVAQAQRARIDALRAREPRGSPRSAS